MLVETHQFPDGTFAAPVKSTTRGIVLSVGDFNEDGKLDVLVQEPPDSTSTSTHNASTLATATFDDLLIVNQ